MEENSQIKEEVNTVSVPEENTVEEESQINEDSVSWLTTKSGTRYYVAATINIPSINCTYPILDRTTDELLKISPCKFWGCDPNEVR